MAYEIPTAADLIARYPAFAAVPVETIDVHIGDAATHGVDTSWLEADYAPAITAFAAHNMALLNIGDHGEIATYKQQGLTGIRSGAFSAQFSDKAANVAASGGLDATPYGRAYKIMLQRNKGGPRLVGGGARADDWGALGYRNDGGIVPWVS